MKSYMRNQFLLRMYNSFWNNITRADDAAWKVMAAYVALYAGLSFAIESIGLFGFVALIILFSLLAASLALNANLWFLRNITLISVIEKELLLDTDLNKIIPKSWTEKSVKFLEFKHLEIWWILFITYLLIPTFTLMFIINKLELIESLFAVIILIIGIYSVILYGMNLSDRHTKLLKAVNRAETYLNRPVLHKKQAGHQTIHRIVRIIRRIIPNHSM